MEMMELIFGFIFLTAFAIYLIICFQGFILGSFFVYPLTLRFNYLSWILLLCACQFVGDLESTKAYEKWAKKVSKTKPPTSPLKRRKKLVVFVLFLESSLIFLVLI